jgi:ABC-type transport system involved in multi-copper enzyme maturation permease subunit
MLSKLIKHEFRATARVLLPVYLFLLITAGLNNLFLQLSDHYDLNRPVEIMRNVLIFIFAASLIVAAVLTLVLMVYRFYKNYMSDEGYLMFTLPVTTGQLVWSKLLVALAWTVITGVVELLALALALMPEGFLRDLLQALRELPVYWPKEMGSLPLFVVQGVLAVLLGVMVSYLMFYAAIALGHSFDNRKLLLSVVFYIAFSILMQIIGTFGSFYLITGMQEYLIMPELPDTALYLLPGRVLTIGVLSAAAGCAVFYLITHLTLRRRLNLQ